MKKPGVSWRTGSLLLGLTFCVSLLAAEVDEADRKVSPADTLTVVVLGEPDLKLELRVEASGIIKFPLLGNVPVSGKTTAEVAKILEEKLDAGFLVNPQVTINVKEYRSATVAVIGEVKKPGAIDLPSERAMEIPEAIAFAEGFTSIASKKKIDLTRNGKTTRYKFDELLEETDPRKKILLEPGDVINVRESWF